MKCEKCKHFRVIYEPIKHFDSGRAVCDKHNLIKDFMTHKELKRLECMEDAVAALKGGEQG